MVKYNNFALIVFLFAISCISKLEARFAIGYCELNDNPCLNGGYCLNDKSNQNGYTCLCSALYIGSICNSLAGSSTSSCINNKCENNSTCYEMSSVEFGCKCPLPLKVKDETFQYGFKGVYCEHQIEPCEPNPCLNNGSCYTKIDGTQYCQCNDHRYSGNVCQNFDPCGNSPCLNKGICLSINDSGGLISYACGCPSGFSGLNCQFSKECTNETCVNGGVCKSNGKRVICKCLKPYAGLQCQIALKEQKSMSSKGSQFKPIVLYIYLSNFLLKTLHLF